METFLKTAESGYEAETDLINLYAQLLTHSSSPELWVYANMLLILTSVKPLPLILIQTYL